MLKKLKDWLGGREFYELMQVYRHIPHALQSEVVVAFDQVKAGILSAAEEAFPGTGDTEGYGLSIEHFKPGQRVELHPGCDRWMRGDRYGEVSSIRINRVYVRMDRSRLTLPFSPDRLRFIKD